MLLVFGTSLKIPGFKALVRQFSEVVHGQRGIAVLVNREAVAAEWDEVFDYHGELLRWRSRVVVTKADVPRMQSSPTAMTLSNACSAIRGSADSVDSSPRLIFEPNASDGLPLPHSHQRTKQLSRLPPLQPPPRPQPQRFTAANSPFAPFPSSTPPILTTPPRAPPLPAKTFLLPPRHHPRKRRGRQTPPPCPPPLRRV